MDLQKFSNSRLGANIGLALGRNIPPNLGYQLSGYIAKHLVKRKSSPIVKAVRQNQWVIRGENISSKELDTAVQDVFTHAGRCFIDLYHNLDNPEGIITLVKDSQKAQEIINLSNDPNYGSEAKFNTVKDSFMVGRWIVYLNLSQAILQTVKIML